MDEATRRSNAREVVVQIAAARFSGPTRRFIMLLAHTPSPMVFLNRILQRPAHEKPFLLLVVGHPAEGAGVPDIRRKPLAAISSFVLQNKF